MFCNSKNIFLSISLILCLVKPTDCMNASAVGGSRIRIGRVFEGNNITVINDQTYIDGVLQNDGGAEIFGSSSQSSWNCKSEDIKTYPLVNDSGISIENSNGDIDVLSHDGTNAILHITKLGATEGDLNNIYADVIVTDKSLQIITKYLNPAAKALINYQLLLPKINKYSCNFKTSSGDTSIKEIDAEVNATSMSGKINVEKVIGTTQAKTSSGDMKFKTITGRLTATTQSGSVEAKKIEGPAQFTSSSGDMDIDTVSQNTEAHTASGTLDIKNIAAILHAVSTSGDMDISNVASHFIGRSVSGRVKAGEIKGNSTIDTSSGDIISDTEGEFKGNSSSGNIKLHKKNINAPITIATSSGDIEICSGTFDAMLEAATRSGDLSSDFAMPVRKNRISAQVGNGGPRVSLRAASGDITLTQN